MKPYKEVDRAKKIIALLQNRRKFNEKISIEHKDINVLIDCVTSFENMLKQRYYTEVIELLLLELIQRDIIEVNYHSQDIPMDYIIYKLDNLITSTTLQEKRKQVAEAIRNNNQKNYFINQKDLVDLLNSTINQIKTQIKWTYKK